MMVEPTAYKFEKEETQPTAYEFKDITRPVIDWEDIWGNLKEKTQDIIESDLFKGYTGEEPSGQAKGHYEPEEKAEQVDKSIRRFAHSFREASQIAGITRKLEDITLEHFGGKKPAGYKAMQEKADIKPKTGIASIDAATNFLGSAGGMLFDFATLSKIVSPAASLAPKIIQPGLRFAGIRTARTGLRELAGEDVEPEEYAKAGLGGFLGGEAGLALGEATKHLSTLIPLSDTVYPWIQQTIRGAGTGAGFTAADYLFDPEDTTLADLGINMASMAAMYALPLVSKKNRAQINRVRKNLIQTKALRENARRDAFKKLGLSENATKQQIKNRWKQVSRKLTKGNLKNLSEKEKLNILSDTKNAREEALKAINNMPLSTRIKNVITQRLNQITTGIARKFTGTTTNELVPVERQATGNPVMSIKDFMKDIKTRGIKPEEVTGKLTTEEVAGMLMEPAESVQPIELPGEVAPGEPIAMPGEVAEEPEPEPETEVFTIYRGTGREDPGSVYTGGKQSPIFPGANYYALFEDVAKEFGPNIEKRDISSKNLLIIETDQEWEQLVNEAGYDKVNELQLPSEKRDQWKKDIKQTIKEKGYKGLVIKFPDNIDVDKGNWGVLFAQFRDQQVILFDKQKQPEVGQISKEPEPEPEVEPEVESLQNLSNEDLAQTYKEALTEMEMAEQRMDQGPGIGEELDKIEVERDRRLKSGELDIDEFVKKGTPSFINPQEIKEELLKRQKELQPGEIAPGEAEPPEAPVTPEEVEVKVGDRIRWTTEPVQGDTTTYEGTVRQVQQVAINKYRYIIETEEGQQIRAYDYKGEMEVTRQDPREYAEMMLDQMSREEIWEYGDKRDLFSEDYKWFKPENQEKQRADVWEHLYENAPKFFRKEIETPEAPEEPVVPEEPPVGEEPPEVPEEPETPEAPEWGTQLQEKGEKRITALEGRGRLGYKTRLEYNLWQAKINEELSPEEIKNNLRITRSGKANQYGNYEERQNMIDQFINKMPRNEEYINIDTPAGTLELKNDPENIADIIYELGGRDESKSLRGEEIEVIKPDIDESQLADKTYYVTPSQKGEIDKPAEPVPVVKAKPFGIEGTEELDLFRYKPSQQVDPEFPISGSNWIVVEGQTGVTVTEGKTIQEAAQKLKEIIDKVGVEGIREKIVKRKGKFGVTPRYGGEEVEEIRAENIIEEQRQRNEQLTERLDIEPIPEEYMEEMVDFARRVGAPARYKYEKATILGAYSPESKEISAQDIADLQTMGHEIGHAIDYKLYGGEQPPDTLEERFDIDVPIEDLKQQLKEVSLIIRPTFKDTFDKSPYRQNAKELIADFYTMYMLNPEMAFEKAPDVTRDFERKLLDNPELNESLREILQKRQTIGPEIDMSDIKPIKRENVERLLPKFIEDKDVDETAKVLTQRRKRYLQLERMNSYYEAKELYKLLSDEKLEDLGGAVEEIGNLRTGKSYEQIMEEMTPEMERALRKYRYYQELSRQRVNRFMRNVGKDNFIKYLEDYLLHFYVERGDKLEGFVDKWTQKVYSKGERTLPTLEDAVNEGLTPITQNVADLHEKWAELNWRGAVNQAYVRELKDLKNEKGEPVLQKPNNAPPSWPRVDHPAIQKVYAHKTKDGKTVLWKGRAAVDPDVYKWVKQVFERPFSYRPIKALETLNSLAKSLNYKLSFFHFFNLFESSMASLYKLRNPLSGLVHGTGRIKTETGERALSKPLMMPHKIGLELLEDEDFRRDLVMHGLNLDPIAEARIDFLKGKIKDLEAKTRNTPGAGRLVEAVRKLNDYYDRKLWNEWFTGLKAMSYYDWTKRILNDPGIVPEEAAPEEIKKVKETIASYINDSFGGQEWERYSWNDPRLQQLLHLVIRAPDYTLSNIRVASRPIIEFFKRPKTRAGKTARKTIIKMGSDYWTGMILFLLTFTAGVNYLLTGRPTYENEVGHQMDIDVTPIVHETQKIFGNYDPEDERKYYASPGKQFKEVLRYINTPFGIAFNKMSPISQSMVEQITKHQAGLGFPLPFASESTEGWEEVPERTIALMRNFIPFSLQGNNFALTLPLRRGMGWWQGQRAYEDLIKSQIDPDFMQQIYATLGPPQNVDEMSTKIDEALKTNGFDPEKIRKQANTTLRNKYYTRFWEAVKNDNQVSQEKNALILIQLGVTGDYLKRSGARRELRREAIRVGQRTFLKMLRKAPRTNRKLQGAR